jgi:hypothetical protein
MSKTEYFVFHKEWYELKKELSAKAWIELEDYMLQLRFDGIDTDPKSIKNKTVRLQWIMIRKKIYDSINNMNRQKKHRYQIANENNPSNVIEPNDDFKVEENNIPCNVEPQEEQINNNNNPKPEENMENPTNIIGSNGKAVVVNEPAVEYRNNTNSISNRIQHLINNDDNFYKVFTNCTKQIAYYKINDTNICASNSIEMAYDKLERMFDEYHIPFNTEANDFIISEVEEIININYN